MNKGKKILDGTVSGVKQQFKEDLFRIGLEEELPATAETAAFEIVGREANSLVVKIAAGHRPNDVLRFFLDRGQNITSFTEILPSLNDIFIRLVEGTPLSRQFEQR
jgi:ABC-2 type transport system ATP-binding protein